MPSMDARETEEALKADEIRRKLERGEPVDQVRFSETVDGLAKAVMVRALKLASDATKMADKATTEQAPSWHRGTPGAVDYIKLGEECVALAERAGMLVNAIQIPAAQIRMCPSCGGTAHEKGCPTIL